MDYIVSAYSQIVPGCIRVNGAEDYHAENFITFAEFIKPFFKRLDLGYPKFYKMDALCKLGFIAAELIFRQVDPDRFDRSRVGIVLSNTSSSLDTDLIHQGTIHDRSQYFPSPSVFVYTLPNIMIGEICIRHRMKGENAFLISEKFDSSLLYTYVNELFQSRRMDACLTGWVDLLGDQWNALLLFAEPAGSDPSGRIKGLTLPFCESTMDDLYNLM